MKGLQGKVAVIVGGSRGIGRAVAEKMVEYKAKVIIGSRTESELEQAVNQLRSIGGEAHGIALDVASRESSRSFSEQVQKQYDRVDILVFCAGVNTRLPAEEYPEEAWEKVININL